MSRNDQIKTERRRRNGDAMAGRRNRLYVDEASLDRVNYAYRFVNDEPGRVHSFTVDDDWEVVHNRSGDMKPDTAGIGSDVSAHAGTSRTGAPLKAVLLRKPKTFYDDDEVAKQRQIDALEAGLKVGQTDGAGVDNGYVPKGGITIG